MRGTHQSIFVVVGIVCLLGIAQAATTDSTTTQPIPGTSLSFGPSSQFKIATMQGMGDMLATCVIGAGAGQLQSYLENGAGACGQGTPLEPEDVTCEMFQTGGKFNAELYNSSKKGLEKAIGDISCQANQLNAAQNQLQCLSSQAAALQNQAASLQSTFTGGIAAIQKDIQQLKGFEEDMNAQLEDISEHLNGDRDANRKGLSQLKEETQAMLEGMTAQINGIREQQKSADDREKAFIQEQQDMKMAGANQCFAGEVNGGYKCTPNGPPVTAVQYVLCRYEQNQRLSATGAVQTSSISTRQAQARASELTALMQKIFQSSPMGASAPKSFESASEGADRGASILSVADVESQYGAELAKFNGNGLDIHKFVMNELNNCYLKSEKSVKKQLANPSSTLTSHAEGIKAERRKVSDESMALLTKASAQYRAAMAGLTGQYVNMDISSCNGAAPKAQMQCLENARKAVQAMWDGTSNLASMNFTIRGTNPQTTIGFQCQGLSGCETKLQALKANRKKDLAGTISFRKQYAASKNAEIRAKTTQAAQALSAQNTQIATLLTQINGKLKSLGVRGAIKTGYVEKADFTENGEGEVLSAPGSILGLISNNIGGPGLVDLNEGTFADSQEGIGEKQEDLEKQAKDYRRAMNKLNSTVETCKAKEMEEINKYLDENVAKLDNCFKVGEICEDYNSDPLDTLGDSVSEALGVRWSNLSGRLATGSRICDPTNSGAYSTFSKWYDEDVNLGVCASDVENFQDKCPVGALKEGATAEDKAKQEKDEASCLKIEGSLKANCPDIYVDGALNGSINDSRIKADQKEYEKWEKKKNESADCKSIYSGIKTGLQTAGEVESRYNHAGAAKDND